MVKRSIFFKAAALTFIIFIAGIFVGYKTNVLRDQDILNEYRSLSIDWTDNQLQSRYYQIFPYSSEESCEKAIAANIKFADKVYEKGKLIERYEKANRITSINGLDKREHNLLKLQFWLNSIEIKKRCNAHYINVVYFYKDSPSDIIRVEQNTQSKVLADIKEKYGPDIMLIPLAIDMDISTIKLVVDQYNINVTPAVLVDEQFKLEGLHSKKEIEKFLVFE